MSEETAKAVLLREALERVCTTKAQRERLIIELLRSGEPLSDDVRDVMADALLPQERAGAPRKPWDWRLALHVAGLRNTMTYEQAIAHTAETQGVSETNVKNAYSRLLAAERESAASKQ